MPCIVTGCATVAKATHLTWVDVEQRLPAAR
jgi:hypothetical protein